MMNLEEGLWNY